MGKLFVNIRSSYAKMSKTEKKIADYLLQNSLHAPLTITEFAQRTGSSEATIVRFAKRLGCDGYQELKLLLAKEDHHIVNQSIEEGDSLQEVYGKLCDDVYATLLQGRKNNDDATFEKACRMIEGAKAILVFGVGNSYAVAFDFNHKLLRLGFRSSAVGDSHLMLIDAAVSNKETLVIGISHSGCTRDVVDACAFAKENGAKVIALTSDAKSPLAKGADLLLHSYSDEMNYRLLGLTSRYAQLAIIDTIYTHIAMQDKNTQKAIDKIESIVIAQRYTKKKRNG